MADGNRSDKTGARPERGSPDAILGPPEEHEARPVLSNFGNPNAILGDPKEHKVRPLGELANLGNPNALLGSPEENESPPRGVLPDLGNPKLLLGEPEETTGPAKKRLIKVALICGAAVLLIVILLIASPWTRKPLSPGELLAQSVADEAAGRRSEAIIHLKNLLALQPENAEARYRIGALYRATGEPRAAEENLRIALEKEYQPKLVLLELAHSLFEQARFEKLLESTRSSDYGQAALQAEILSLRGHSQLQLGMLREAAESFDEALIRESKHVSAILGRVRLSIIKRDPAAALSGVTQALAIDPKNLNAWLMKGDLDRAAGKVDAALEAYEKALALNTKSVASNLNLASIYLAMGKLDQARKSVEVIRQVLPNNVLGYYLLGLVEYRSGNFAAADGAIQEVLKNAPNYVPAKALSGLIAYSVGANDQAEQRLAEALSKYPSNVLLRKLYAASLLRADKVKPAMQLLDVLVKTVPNDRDVLALMAEAKFQDNDIPAARHYFELALKRDPENTRARLGLGLARMASGDTERALADLEAVAEIGGTAADAFLVTSLVSVKQFDKALAAVTRLEKRRPNDALTFNMKGSVLAAKGDLAGARSAFEHAARLQPGKVAAVLNLAQLDFRQGNSTAARNRLENAAQKHKENTALMLALADLAVAGKQWDEAEKWMQRAKQLEPAAFNPANALAKLKFVQGDYSAAMANAQIALNAAPENLETLNVLAYSQLRLGQVSESFATYSNLVRLAPKSAAAHYGLAGAQIAAGSHSAAEASLRTALRLQPNFPEAMYSLASNLIQTRKLAEARKVIADAQKRFPKGAMGFVLEGDAAMADKRYDLASGAYETALGLEKSRVVVRKLHDALVGRGRAAQAEAITADWLQKNPNDTEMRYFVADRALKHGNFALAAEHYRELLKKEPNKLPLLHNLTWAYDRANDPRAIEVAETAYKLAPENPGALHNLGRLLVDRGNTNRAIELLERARMLTPASQAVRYQLAMAYFKAGDNNRAREELQRLLRGREKFDERAEAEELLKRLLK